MSACDSMAALAVAMCLSASATSAGAGTPSQPTDALAAPCEVTISTVRLANGTPVPGAVVTIDDVSRTTDHDGLATFVEPAGDISVHVSYGKYVMGVGQSLSCPNHRQTIRILLDLDFVDPRRWLVPCSEYRKNWDGRERYEMLVNDVLALDRAPADATVLARLTVRPSFAPEWFVRLLERKDERCSIQLGTAHFNLANVAFYGTCDDAPCPMKIGAAFKEVPIACGAARDVRDAWYAMTARLRPPQPGDPVISDGVDYSVELADGAGIPNCGFTHAPPAESPAGSFADLADRVRAFVNPRADERTVSEAEIESLAKGLSEMARKPDGGSREKDGQ